MTSHSPTSAADATHEFYEGHAAEYFERTVHADLSHLYARFLPLLPAGARILDIGCGSGRDLKVFKSMGYRPFGIDPSAHLIELAHQYAGVECEVLQVEDMTYLGEFDAVWACASLLHLPKAKLATALARIEAALRRGGVFFAAVQAGQGEQAVSDGRFYAYYGRDEFVEAVVSAGFELKDAWLTEDSLQDRPTIRWVNVLARASRITK